MWLLEDCINLFGGQKFGGALLPAVKTEASAKSSMKFNSCAYQQKKRIGRWYVCTSLFP
jgi:hypothetical protein